jgi:hypothetical protein
VLTSRRSRASRRALGPGLTVALALATAGRASEAADHPASRTSSLSWIRLPGAEACVSAQDLARDVEQRLGHPVFVSPSQAGVSVEGRIEHADGASGAHGSPGWHAVVVLRDAHGASLGTRELRREGASCDVMRAPLALIIVIMIDPDAALSGPSLPAPPAPSPPPPPVIVEKRVPVFIPVAGSPPRRPPSWHLDAGSSFIGGLGLLPNPAIGLAGGAILAPPPGFFGLQAYGALWLNQSVAAGAQGSETFSLGYVGGGLCPVTIRSRLLDAFGCASGQLGYLLAYGPASTPNQGQVHLAGAVEARGTIHIAGPFTARAGVLVLVPLIRNSFVYDEPGGGQAPVFKMSPVAATADLGLGVAFP